MRILVRFALASAIWATANAAAAQETVIIRSLESPVVFHAQFNPKEIMITKSVPWQKHRSSKGDAPTLEFTDTEPRTFQAEFLFDTFEAGTDVHQTLIAPLEALALIDPGKKRPPLVQVEWGAGFPAFRGVIESIDVKYTLFLADGTPVRAIAAVLLKEAQSVRVKQGDPASVISCEVPGDCPPGQSCFSGACAPGQQAR